VKRIKFLIATIILIALPFYAFAQTGPSVMQKLQDSQKATSSAMDIKLSLVEPNGEVRERRIQTLTLTENDLTSTITVFLSPASVKNTRFLTKEKKGGGDDQWIFLPAIGRIKRIAASEGSGSFMGSDFSYSDMASTTYDVDEAEHTLIGEESIYGREAYIIESIPLAASDYGKTVIWVDKEHYLPLKVEFYAKDGKTLVKHLLANEIKNVEGRWITKVMTMTTVASKHSTRIDILQAKYDIPMNRGYFTTSFLETGRVL